MLSIGIHIYKDSLCFAALDSSGGAPSIKSIGEFFFENQNQSEEEKHLFISNHIKKIIQDNKGLSLRFCWGLPQSSAAGFLMSFPFKEKFKILKTLPFEIEDQTPFRADKVFFDARLCRLQGKSSSSALCFASPEERVRELESFASALGAPPYLISCEGSALACLLESWGKPLSQRQNPQMESLFIYLGKEGSRLLFYREGFLERVSDLDWGAAPIVKEMEKIYKLEPEKAWAEFYKKSFILTEGRGFSKEQVFFSRLVKKHISLLVPKLKLLKMSLEADQKTQIKQALVFGPGAVIKNLTAFLSAELFFEASRLPSLAALPRFDQEKAPSAAPALGLALEGLKSSPYPGLNFLQSRSKGLFSFFPKKHRKSAAALALVFVLFTGYSFIRKGEAVKILNGFNEVFENYGKRIAFLPGGKVNIDSIKSFLEKEKNKLEGESFIEEKLNKAQPIDHLKAVAQRLGPAKSWGLSLRYLKIEEGKVDIEGFVEIKSLNSFKLKVQSLAKGPLKENPRPLYKVKSDSKPAREELKKEDSKKASEGGKKEEALVRADQKEPPSDEARIEFSYSFDLKENI